MTTEVRILKNPPRTLDSGQTWVVLHYYRAHSKDTFLDSIRELFSHHQMVCVTSAGHVSPVRVPDMVTDGDWSEVTRLSLETSLSFLRDEPDLYSESDGELV